MSKNNARRFLNTLRMNSDWAAEHAAEDARCRKMPPWTAATFASAEHWLEEEMMWLNDYIEHGDIVVKNDGEASDNETTPEIAGVPTKEFMKHAGYFADVVLRPESVSFNAKKVPPYVAKYFSEVVGWLEMIQDFYEKYPGEFIDCPSTIGDEEDDDEGDNGNEE